MLLAGSISGRPHSKWWWCHDIGYPLLTAEHSPCKSPWSGIPCRTTSTYSRTTSPLDSAWKRGFSLATSVFSALETSWQLRYINSHLPLSLSLLKTLIKETDNTSPIKWLPRSGRLQQTNMHFSCMSYLIILLTVVTHTMCRCESVAKCKTFSVVNVGKYLSSTILLQNRSTWPQNYTSDTKEYLFTSSVFFSQ